MPGGGGGLSPGWDGHEAGQRSSPRNELRLRPYEIVGIFQSLLFLAVFWSPRDTKRIVPEWTSLAGNQEARRAAEEGRRSCERITPVRVREGVLSIFVCVSSVAPRRVKWFLCVVV